MDEQEEMAKQMAQKHTLSEFVSTAACGFVQFRSIILWHWQLLLTKNFAGNVPTWKIWDIKSTQAKKIHFAIGEMIAIDSQPFLFVEDLGFKRWMKILQT